MVAEASHALRWCVVVFRKRLLHGLLVSANHQELKQMIRDCVRDTVNDASKTLQTHTDGKFRFPAVIESYSYSLVQLQDLVILYQLSKLK